MILREFQQTPRNIPQASPKTTQMIQEFLHKQVSNEKRAPGWLDYIGDEILPSYIGIIISHYKDPYEPTSIMESKRFFFVAQVVIPGVCWKMLSLISSPALVPKVRPFVECQRSIGKIRESRCLE